MATATISVRRSVVESRARLPPTDCASRRRSRLFRRAAPRPKLGGLVDRCFLPGTSDALPGRRGLHPNSYLSRLSSPRNSAYRRRRLHINAKCTIRTGRQSRKAMRQQSTRDTPGHNRQVIRRKPDPRTFRRVSPRRLSRCSYPFCQSNTPRVRAPPSVPIGNPHHRCSHSINHRHRQGAEPELTCIAAIERHHHLCHRRKTLRAEPMMETSVQRGNPSVLGLLAQWGN